MSHLVPLAIAAIVAALATPLVARLARKLRLVDRPNERKVSLRDDMPLLGGLAVAAGGGVGFAVGLWLHPDVVYRGHIEGLLFGVALMLVVGLWDDWRGLSAWSKFAWQLVAAGIAIASDFKIDHLTDPIAGEIVWLPTWAVWIASTLWILIVTNAVNLIDGLDGLATGVSGIIGATLTVIAWQMDQTFGVCVGVALVGGLLGFLPYNFPPARIFLGDTGSLSIGFTLALLALEGTRNVSLLTFLVPLLALAVPILDTLLSILRRIRRRQPIFSADRLHMHHRLLASEASERSAVLQFYFLTGCFCLIAVSFTRLQGYAAMLFLVAVVILTLRLLWNLGAFSLEPTEPGAAKSKPSRPEERES